MISKGNGNGGDLGHALSGMTRLPTVEHDAKGVASDNGTPSAAVSPPERQPARVIPPAPPAVPRIEIPESRADRPASDRPEAIGPESARPEIASQEPEGAEADHPEKFSAEETFVESATAEEVSLDEAVIEAAAPSGESPAPKAPATSAAAGSDATPGGTDGTGSDDGTADREAVRDARLLRFVYVMAALTGIVAIVLYAGGWLREGPAKRAPEEAVASASQSAQPEITAKTVAPPAAVESPAASDSPAIPPAPPVTAPSVTEAKPGAPETAVTTGGPPKPQAESAMPAPAESPAGVAEKPAMPSETQQAAVPNKPDMPPAAGETAKSPGASVAAEQPPAAKVTAPKAIAPSGSSDEAAGGKAVRDVPNMRVLAPALVKPEPAETAPPSKPETGSVPAVTAPAVDQTAALPKARPAKPAHAAKGGHFYIQLASVGSEKVAAHEWTRLQKAYPDVLRERELVIEKKEIAGRGTFYRVQSGGFKSLEEARSVCNTLKAKKQACLAVKR